MAISQSITTSFKTDILSGGMNFNTTNRALTVNTQDKFVIALYTTSATLGPSTTAYTSTDEVPTATGYTALGKTLTISQVPTSTGTTAFTDFDDISWTSASFSADGALIYNATNSNKSVLVLNFGGTKTVTSGTFTIQFPTADASNAIIRIA
jgi:hypothetical protein